MILDGEHIRQRRIELRLSHRAVAAHLGVSPAAVRCIEDGRNHNDLSLATIVRLADTLAVGITTLFRPATPTDPPTDDTDVATLGSALHAAGTLTPTAAIAQALGWTIDRTNQAADRLANTLTPAGLRLHRLNGQLAIERATEPIDPTQLKAVVRAHLLRAGMNLTEARLLRRIADGRRVKELSNPDAVAYGTLTNAGLVDADGALADDVAYSLALDSRPS